MDRPSHLPVLEAADGWLLLEEKTINDRTLLCYYNAVAQEIQLVLFHLTDQPNKLSQRAPYSNWGYATHLEGRISTEKEAAEVVGLYLKDMENDNAWWEIDK